VTSKLGYQNFCTTLRSRPCRHANRHLRGSNSHTTHPHLKRTAPRHSCPRLIADPQCVLITFAAQPYILLPPHLLPLSSRLPQYRLGPTLDPHPPLASQSPRCRLVFVLPASNHAASRRTTDPCSVHNASDTSNIYHCVACSVCFARSHQLARHDHHKPSPHSHCHWTRRMRQEHCCKVPVRSLWLQLHRGR
jgi:hypothetical protein